ncbi:MAG TPA: autotransporter-associated beta strand repeat-containing protein, partial [Verrucomicrobiae bacterium]|nr:autotransporter-associated beta strand repeat-containing protein [Verrucomicrobiae bacterium]
TQFTIIKYSGAIGGAGFNFGLGDVPSPSTDGFISNNVANSSVDLVLRDGPKPLTWTGVNGSDWDIATTTNWVAFGLTPTAFLNADSVFFYDTAATNVVNLTTALLPAVLTVSNQVLNYSFTGGGNLSGFTGLFKEGAGTLTLANSGINDFRGGVTVNGGTLVLATDNSISGGVSLNSGTVQVGAGGTTGNLPSGNVVNQSGLIFNRSGDLMVANAISGSGGLTNNGAGTVTLSGNNENLLGPIQINTGTLKTGSATALGDAGTGTTAGSGGTLDVNGQTLGIEVVTVSGVGVGGQGAIINTGAGANNALRNVTLAGDVTFGGTGRWDIRESAANTTDATLNTVDSLDHKITKIGANQVSLVGVQVSNLGDVDVQAGIFSVETGTTSLGNPVRTLTVAAGATLQLFNATTAFDKVIVLNGNGLANTLNNGAGENILVGPITLNGNCIVNAGGTSLTLSGAIGGGGGLTKTGGSALSLTGNDTYTGPTVVSGGVLFVDGAKTGGGGITVNATGTLGGVGSIGEPVTLGASGTLSPGNATSPTASLRVAGSLTIAGTVVFDVLKSGGVFSNDTISNVTALSWGGTLQVNLDANTEPLASGDVIKLFDAASYTGSFVSIQPGTPGAGLMWDASSLAVNGTLKVADALPPEPEIEGVAVAGGNIIFSGTGGAPNGTYYVLISTNVALPLANWSRATTNLFDATGAFSVTNAVNPNVPQQFYVLQLQ